MIIFLAVPRLTGNVQTRDIVRVWERKSKFLDIVVYDFNILELEVNPTLITTGKC
jgi:hypothetical protein